MVGANNQEKKKDLVRWKPERVKRMKCRAKNKGGKGCGAPAVGGTNRCVMHSGRAAELGSKGGRRRTVYSPDSLKEFSAPKSAADLRDLLAQSIVEIRTGKLDRKLANSISDLGTGFLALLRFPIWSVVGA
jgi:hypothetical protein